MELEEFSIDRSGEFVDHIFRNQSFHRKMIDRLLQIAFDNKINNQISFAFNQTRCVRRNFISTKDAIVQYTKNVDIAYYIMVPKHMTIVRVFNEDLVNIPVKLCENLKCTSSLITRCRFLLCPDP